jgi:hypothetical protein
MKTNPDIKKLTKFITSKKNNKNKLITHFKYASIVTIYQWLKRGSLPRNKRERILKYIQKAA